MPRKSAGVKPSAAGRFAQSPGGQDDGKQLDIGTFVSNEDLGVFVRDCIGSGASVTFRLTRNWKTLTVSFFVDGENYPWYIQSQDDWDAMLVKTSVDRG